MSPSRRSGVGICHLCSVGFADTGEPACCHGRYSGVGSDGTSKHPIIGFSPLRHACCRYRARRPGKSARMQFSRESLVRQRSPGGLRRFQRQTALLRAITDDPEHHGASVRELTHASSADKWHHLRHCCGLRHCGWAFGCGRVLRHLAVPALVLTQNLSRPTVPVARCVFGRKGARLGSTGTISVHHPSARWTLAADRAIAAVV